MESFLRARQERTAAISDAVVAAGIPVVCLDRAAVGNKGGFRLAGTMYRARAAICVRHLLRVGYRNIAVITGPT